MSIGKLWRRIVREKPLTATGFGVISAMAVPLGVGLAATGILPVAVGVGFALGFPASTLAMEWGDEDGIKDNRAQLNGVTLLGDSGDLTRLYFVQKKIDDICKKYAHRAELPPKACRRIRRHIMDVEDLLKDRVRVAGGESFSFIRNAYDADGRAIALPVSSHGGMNLPAPQAPVSLPQVSDQFNQINDKIEGIEQRLDRVENPAPQKLDKPKFGSLD